MKDKEGQLPLSEAKRLSLLKWNANVEAGGDANIPDECINLVGFCGFCERHKNNMFEQDCSKCELLVNGHSCTHSDHPFSKWCESRSGSPEELQYAIEVRDLILAVPE